MSTLKFKIRISASPEKVWETMLHPVTYREWVNVSWPGSRFEGTWEQGQHLKFVSQNEGGTMAILDEHQPYEFSKARHIAVINRDGSLDKDSDVAKGWVGTTESYTFTEIDGVTELGVEINCQPEWEAMFKDGWPSALEKLKEISER
jgi:uncharacterized protein YndB with AHSA1/START domain